MVINLYININHWEIPDWLTAVRDRLISPDSCYQAGLTADDSDLSYQDAADFCSELKGTLATEAGLRKATSLLTQLRPHTEQGGQFQWWLQGDSTETCKTVSSDGSVTELACTAAPSDKTLRRPLCHLGKTSTNKNREIFLVEWRRDRGVYAQHGSNCYSKALK